MMQTVKPQERNTNLKLYRSVSVSNLAEANKVINNINKNDYVFISLHVAEENDKDYINNTKKLCLELYKKKARIIADISKRTLDKFKCKSFINLYKELHIYAYRFDYGFTLNEIIKLGKEFAIVINASTYLEEDLKKILKSKPKHLLAMHNFYPRKETGLDLSFFINKTLLLRKHNVEVFSFIKGDKALRGPLYEGLLTLEHQRDLAPSEAFNEYKQLNLINGVFLGDLGISSKELNLINKNTSEGIIKLQAKLLDKNLYNKVFTCRYDSPSSLIRVKESREYSCQGKIINPKNCVTRVKGSITIDNKLYKRYSGEIMITKKDYPLDKKVNVVGRVLDSSLDKLKDIKGNTKFTLIK